MSNVTLAIGGRPYTVACDPGEERHVEALGRSIDAKLNGVPGLTGQSEARTLLFAALLLADELHELKRNAGPLLAPDKSQADAGLMAETLENIAERLESLAVRLESSAGAT